MSFRIPTDALQSAFENLSRSPAEENLLVAWNKIEELKRRSGKDELIGMSECGLDGPDDEDSVYAIEFKDDGTVYLDIEITGIATVPLDALFRPGDERGNLDQILRQLFSDREAIPNAMRIPSGD